MRLTAKESGDSIGGRINKWLGGEDIGDGFQTLVNQGIANINARVVCFLEHLTQDLIHLLTRVLVVCAQVGKDFQDLHLDPGSRQTVVVVVFRQTVLDYLFEDDNEGVD